MHRMLPHGHAEMEQIREIVNYYIDSLYDFITISFNLVKIILWKNVNNDVLTIVIK